MPVSRSRHLKKLYLTFFFHLRTPFCLYTRVKCFHFSVVFICFLLAPLWKQRNIAIAVSDFVFVVIIHIIFIIITSALRQARQQTQTTGERKASFLLILKIIFYTMLYPQSSFIYRKNAYRGSCLIGCSRCILNTAVRTYV